VVEDDDDMRHLLVEMINQLGHAADPACDGVDAVESLGAQSYDFMLLDLTMPRMTGEDVLRWVGEHPAWTTGLRIIVASGRYGAHQLSAEALGVQAVLPKPFTRAQLRDLLVGATRARPEQRHARGA
jgi:CheY-like chemotaxis protein